MKKNKTSKILQFPSNLTEAERQVEAVLFAAEEPLDLKTIQERLKAKANVIKVLNGPYRN